MFEHAHEHEHAPACVAINTALLKSKRIEWGVGSKGLAKEINPGIKSTGIKSTWEGNQPRNKINPSTKSTKVGKKSTKKILKMHIF